DFHVTGVQTCALPIYADGESLDAAGQRRLVIRFGDQVQVIALQRQLGDAKPIALAGRLERRQYRPIADCAGSRGRLPDATSRVRSEERRVGKEDSARW